MWVENYGTDSPLPGEPTYRVTAPGEAVGERPANRFWWTQRESWYPVCRGRLDWRLPLDGRWSDLQASFDLVEHDGKLAFVLVALRVP